LRAAAVRLLFCSLGATAILWSIIVLPQFVRDFSLNRIAERLIRGESFRTDVLMNQLHAARPIELDEHCAAITRRNTAILWLYLAETSLAMGFRDRIDGDLQSLNRSLLATLTCSPAEPFTWALLFWANAATHGYSTSMAGLLRMSYSTGPREGWIALKRNHVSLALLDSLPPDVGESALQEFTGLLETGFHGPAADLFLGPARRHRAKLLARLVSVSERQRFMFARALRDRGYEGTIETSEPREARPWR
jgi:hypothetical protein